MTESSRGGDRHTEREYRDPPGRAWRCSHTPGELSAAGHRRGGTGTDRGKPARVHARDRGAVRGRSRRRCRRQRRGDPRHAIPPVCPPGGALLPGRVRPLPGSGHRPPSSRRRPRVGGVAGHRDPGDGVPRRHARRGGLPAPGVIEHGRLPGGIREPWGERRVFEAVYFSMPVVVDDRAGNIGATGQGT